MGGDRIQNMQTIVATVIPDPHNSNCYMSDSSDDKANDIAASEANNIEYESESEYVESSDSESETTSYQNETSPCPHETCKKGKLLATNYCWRN